MEGLVVDLTEYFKYSEPMPMNGVSLFAGVGGFDLAMERHGIKVVAHCEIDKNAKKVLAQRFPNAVQFDDVKELSGNDLITAGFVPSRGILTGGFPCQDLSVAGKRLGFGGERSSLFYEIARLADETQAEWLVLENVPGLLTSQRGADMGAVVGTLVELGYGLSWRVLDAQYFGVPQRRRRVFIVARRAGNVASATKVLFERTGLRGDYPQGGTKGEETARNAGEGVEVSGTLTAAGIRCDLNKATNGWLTVDQTSTVYGQTGFARYSENQVTTLSATTYKRPEDNVVVRQSVRRLTPLECERLQGFPDNWTEGQADTHRYKQMGNAVAVPVVEWIIQGIVEENK